MGTMHKIANRKKFAIAVSKLHMLIQNTPEATQEKIQFRKLLRPKLLQHQLMLLLSQVFLLTPEQIREMINASVASAVRSMGLNGQYLPHLYSYTHGALNHMTFVHF